MSSAEFNPKTITIYSVGLLGGSLGMAFKASGFSGRIIGLSSPGNLDSARSLNVLDEGYGYDALKSVITSTDILFLCSPISGILQTLDLLASMPLPDGLIITDVGSTKKDIVEKAAQVLPPHVRFIGGHPMAGAEKSGAAASDPYLFQNALYVLTTPLPQPSETDRSFAAFLCRYLGCRHAFLEPDTHDAIAATVSHVPHLLAVALANCAAEVERDIPGALDLAAGGFRDMTRIAAAPFSIWRDIFATNRSKTTAILDRLIATLNAMRGRIGQESLGSDFDAANSVRRRIPARNKGFIRQLSEVLVVAADQPGIIAALAQALAARKINIKDIEVLKVREGEGGTIRLAFDTHEIAREAIKTLNAHGFTARERD